jgi:hypothetical protein
MRPKSEQPKPDEAMRKTASALIDVAIRAFMKMHGINRETAERWIVSAVETVVEDSKPIPKKPTHKKRHGRRVARRRPT